MNQTPERPAGRADLAWGRIPGKSESGSFVEDELAALLDQEVAGGRFRVDVMHLDPGEARA